MDFVQNYTETINPDNRFKFICKDNTDSIIVGASCEHIFEVPFIYSEFVKSAKVIYKQGLDTIIELPVLDQNVVERAADSIIKVNLTPMITELFRQTVLDTFVQLRIIAVNDEVLYDKPHKIIVKEPLVVEPLVFGEE